VIRWADANVRIAITLVSIIVSIAFAAFGTLLTLASDDELFIRGSGVFSIIYGVAGLAALALAWLRPFRGLASVAGTLAAIQVVLFVIGSLDLGMISGLEAASIIVAAFAVSVNWYAVHLLVRGAR
jgi:hypothetical protein